MKEIDMPLAAGPVLVRKGLRSFNSASTDDTPGWLHPRMIHYLVLSSALLALFLLVQRNASMVIVTQFLVIDLSIVILSVFIGWVSFAFYRSFNTRSLLFISIGFLGSSIIELLHVVKLSGLEFDLVSADFLESRNWSFTAGRLFLIVLLLFGWRSSEGRISPTNGTALSPARVVLNALVLLVFLIAATLLLLRLPALRHEPMNVRILNFSIGLMYLGLLYVFLRRGDWRIYPFQHWFVLSIILAVFSQLIFRPLLGQPGDTIHLTGSLLWLTSSICVVVALLSSTTNLFRQASQVQLEERINQLIDERARATNQEPEGSFGHRNNRAAAFELDLITGKFEANRTGIGLVGGLNEAKSIQTLEQFRQAIHPDDRARMVEALRQSVLEGDTFKQEYRLLVANGYRWIESIGGVEFVDGKPSSLLGFLHDVTDRKELQLEKDHLFRELEEMHSALDACAATARCDMNGTLTAANRQFCAFLDTEEEQLIGRKIDTLLMPDQEEGDASEIWRSMFSGNAWQGHMLPCKTTVPHQTIRVEISTHMDDDGRPDGIVFLGMDVTARVSARHALEKSIAAHRKSNEDLEMFAHIVSHDLQEPLRMVTSFMTLLERRYASDLNPEAQEFIQFAVEGANRMSSLLEGQMEFSRVQTKPLVFERVDLNEAVAQAISNLSVLIEERGAEIRVDELPKIDGDDAQLMQLFQNLIANGIKFCHLRPPRIEVRFFREAGDKVVQVSDNGVGIEPAHYGKIFQMFQRLHSRNDFPGTGVGLTVCQRIMERHGGSIEVESLVGQGSTFTLRF